MKRSTFTKIKIFAILGFITIIVYAALAHSNGSVSGKTSSTSDGCSCHSSSANSETSVSVVSGTGSFNVDPNSVTTFTITVTNAVEVSVGVDIGVKTTQFGETDIGTLAPVNGSGLQNNGAELTQTSPKALSGGSCSFQFTWTAPSTPGTYYLRCIANAVNGNGTNDAGDHWNWMPVQAITVNAPPGISITSPVGGEAWCQNSAHNITWTSSGIANVMIELSSDGGSSFQTLVASTSGSAQSWSWNIGSQAVGNTYKVRLSDASNPSTMSVSPGNFSIPDVTAINTQPQSQTKCTGQGVSFSLAATGGGLTYSWRKNGTAIPNTNSPNYNIQSVAVSDAGTYDCVVTGACGSPVTSSQATLTVNLSPSITQNPASQTVCAGQGVSFTVAATATGITYQWRKNAQNISGANSTSYIIANTTTNDAGQYDCVVNGTCNTPATSGQATLIINTAPQITQQPQDANACDGSNAKFKVVATGGGLTYQWRKDAINIQNENNDSLIITNVNQSKTGHYDVIVTSTCLPPVTSSAAFLNLNTKPTITQQPVSQSVSVGGSTDFTVIASGSNLTYQWSKNSTTISGATTNDLHINNSKLTDAGLYSCSINNDCGKTVSSSASLTVVPAGSGPVLTLKHSTIDFGTVLINTQKDTIFTDLIKNTGTQTLSISSMSFNPTTTEFSLINPPSLPFNILGDSSATLGIRFSPKTQGVKNISLEFSSNASTNPTMNLTGIGGEIIVNYSDTSLDHRRPNLKLYLQITILFLFLQVVMKLLLFSIIQ
ncbi:MAG: immunoglobulin domain-containing protein [FCB group bacterium]